MPLSLEEYQVAQMYMVMKMQQQSTTGDEGVEVLQNRPFSDDEFGGGQYTSKFYHLQSKAPSWLTTFAPADALVMQEEAWNAYPKCRSVVKSPYFLKFFMSIDTIHKADNGYSENVHGLSEDQLAVRQVEVIDIASATTDYWSYIVGRNNVDFSNFQSARCGRGPLLEGWQYQVAQMYMVMKMQQQSTTGDEGVEVLQNRPFSDDEFGGGQYTSKFYHLQSKAPSWLTTFAPADALVMQEEAWNAYPKCRSVVKSLYFSKFFMSIDTIHKADNGYSENVHGLSEDQLAVRQVEVIDIASATTDYWSYIVGRNNVDFSNFQSARCGRGPLLEGWQKLGRPCSAESWMTQEESPLEGEKSVA